MAWCQSQIDCVLSLLFILLLVYFLYRFGRTKAFSSPDPPKISVNGQAQDSFPPDTALVTLGIRQEGTNPSALQNNVQTRMYQTINAYTADGFDKVTTESFSLMAKPEPKNTGVSSNRATQPFGAVTQPFGAATQSSRSTSQPLLSTPVYIMRQTIKVETTPALVARTLDIARGQNVDSIDLAWSLKDAQKQRAILRSKAIKDAQDKAQQAAQMLNTRLGQVLSFSEYSSGMPMGRTVALSIAPDVASESDNWEVTRVPTGNIDLSETVNIDWELVSK